MNKHHPADVGLTYWSHFRFAWKEMVRLECMAFVMFTHGLLPWVWDHKFSRYIKEANKRITIK
jgi:hypothetical protein